MTNQRIITKITGRHKGLSQPFYWAYNALKQFKFIDWPGHAGVLSLAQITPSLVGAYIERRPGEPPTVKQHLDLIRILLDWLVVGQVLQTNPAAAVRGPKYVVKHGKTPVLTPDQAQQLLDSIDAGELIRLRDRAHSLA